MRPVPIRFTSFMRSADFVGTTAGRIRASSTTITPRLDDANRRASTIASAIEINRPVNLYKCLRALECCKGVVREVTDEQMLDAKAQVGANGLGLRAGECRERGGCESASRRRSHRAERTSRVHSYRPSAQGSNGDRGVSHADQKEFNRVLGSRGVSRAEFANRAVQVENNLEEIVRRSI